MGHPTFWRLEVGIPYLRHKRAFSAGLQPAVSAAEGDLGRCPRLDRSRLQRE